MHYTFDFTPIVAAWPAFLNGAIQTLKISSISMVLGMILGILFMLMRVSRHKAIKAVAVAYVELIRNTPFLVQVFFIYFGMPALGLRLGAEEAAIFAMALNCGAYASEIIRGGVDSIRKGQIEAGRALGLGTFSIYRFIVMRPAIRAVYPALCSQFVLMMLNTSLVSSISAEELTYAAQVVDAQSFRSFEVYLVLGAIYLVISQIMFMLLQRVGKIYFSYPTK